MTQKATYEALEKRIKELELEILEYRQMEESFQEREQKLEKQAQERLRKEAEEKLAREKQKEEGKLSKDKEERIKHLTQEERALQEYIEGEHWAET